MRFYSVLPLLLTVVPLLTSHSGGPPPRDPYPRQLGLDAEHYRFQLSLRDDTDRIEGEAVIDFRIRQPGVSGMWLDLTSTSFGSGGKGMTVSEVTSGGDPAQWVHEEDRIRITLDDDTEVGDVVSITVTYGGFPAAGLNIGPNKYGERTFFSVNWPNRARQWLPMIDHPYDKATSEFIVTAPSHYQVVANGLLQEETDLPDRMRRTHWKQSVPIPSWLNALGVARFASRHFGTLDGIPLQTWVFHQDREEGIATFETPVREAMTFFSHAIGPYPYEKLANVEAAGMGGGMEHASVIFYGARSVTMEPA
ncbi:MAG: M1 family peptidase, partial [Gemmatimonadetes bacterium]|nr:M1 family peptidase [Gemmatimonadota bacterium]